MELDRDLPDFPAFAVMGKPGMLQVRAHQYQLNFINFAYVIAYHPLSAFCIHDHV